MATTSARYNILPTLEEAETRSGERDQVFATVARLLAMYNNSFGLCLVHAHCTLADDEIMLARDSISQPEKASSVKEYYPERWLPDGTPYESTTTPTVPPPAGLIQAFNTLTSHIGVLGLYYVSDEHQGRMIEHTEGRKNILKPSADTGQAGAADNYTETAWNLGRDDPVAMACVIICDTRSTRGGAVHKGTRTHIKSNN
ncbi:MAG: hypothetical protein Q9170_007720 [Blastenia crenularia]